MRNSLLTSLFLVLLVSVSEAQQPKLSGEATRLADKIIDQEFNSQKLVGVAVALIKNKKIVYVLNRGYENREKKISVSAKTRFRWASISKPVTAVAALQLWEQGKLDLDADIRKYVPEFPKKHGVITTRQLLCHQGGIVHYSNGAVIRTRKQYGELHPFKNVIYALDRFKASPLVAKPGERHSYTTHGYILLSAVVQRAGKQDFATQSKLRIFEPLKMKTMRPDYQWEKIPHRAYGYRKTLGTITRSTNTDVSWKLGGGGFLSNIEDLALFAAGLMDGQVLGAKARKLAWVRQQTATGRKTSYGLGFSVSGKNKELRVGHTGAQEKTRTFMSFYPEKGIGIVVMTNSEYGKPRKLGNRLWKVLAMKGRKAKIY
jgi:serine beta-lactamase-like protein LACTB, mitochondrial